MSKEIYLLSPTAKESTTSLPMIDFTLLLQKVDVSGYDLLLFTSKQAVKSAEALSLAWKDIPCLAIGAATAKVIEVYGGTVAYQPKTFYASVLGEDIVERFKTKKILYLRPKVVSFDTKAFLAQSGIEIDEKIIYETKCRCYSKEDKPKKNAIIIFTSPSTIHCFFKDFDWDESYTAVLIGEATRKHLPSHISYVLAEYQTIDACISKAKSLL